MLTPSGPEGSSGREALGMWLNEWGPLLNFLYPTKMNIMNYKVLARAWRPKNFAEFVGQPYVVQALTHALMSKRLHHAYLFSGTRGVGKTTLARILAKALNCETGITPEPCQRCAACVAIDEGRFPDLIEMDAASHTKVEDMRTLLEHVPYAPSIGRYKVYLMDEVHMLSNHSFNALLKTLEEPPSHVIFILATTEPEKLPVTLLSRCLQFQLQLIPIKDIQQQLSRILTQENISFEPEAIETIAMAAKGSLRDALSLLERAMTEGIITLKTVQAWLGSASFEEALGLVEALVQDHPAALLEKADISLAKGLLPERLLDKMLEVVHLIALTQVAPAYPLLVGKETLRRLAQTISPDKIQLYYQILLLGKQDQPLAPSPDMGFQMTLLRLLAFSPEIVEIHPHPTLPRKAEEGHKAQFLPSTNMPEWYDVVSKLPLTGLVKIIAEHSVCTLWEGNQIHLQLDSEQKPLLNAVRQKALQTALSDYAKSPIMLTITVGEGGLTPAKQIQQKQQAIQQTLNTSATADPTLQAFLKDMGATIERVESSEGK